MQAWKPVLILLRVPATKSTRGSHPSSCAPGFRCSLSLGTEAVASAALLYPPPAPVVATGNQELQSKLAGKHAHPSANGKTGLAD